MKKRLLKVSCRANVSANIELNYCSPNHPAPRRIADIYGIIRSCFVICFCEGELRLHHLHVLAVDPDILAPVPVRPASTDKTRLAVQAQDAIVERRKVVRRRCRIEEKLFTSAHFVALLLVASSSLRTAEDSRRPLTAALQETLKKTGAGAADKLINALALFADLAPLGCSSAEYANDKLLQAVATSKSREVKQVFHFAVIRELPHDVGELTFQFVMPRKAPFFRQRDAAEEVQVKGIVKQSRRGAEVTIGTTGGEKAITATVPHDDGTLAALVHAASLGGTVDFLLERTVLECEAAPQLKRVVCSIKEVKPGKDMLCYLQSLRQAVQRFMDELASEDPDQAA